MADERDLIRSRVNIVDLVSQRLPLKKSGKSWTGLCPFHNDRNPSFHVSPDTGRYRCWSCGASGDIFNWVMETQKLEFREALQFLADLAGVKLASYDKESADKRKDQLEIMEVAQTFFRDQLASNPDAIAYCNQRGLTSDVREAWGLGYGPESGDLLGQHLRKRGITLADAQELFLVQRDDTGGYFDRFRSRLIIPIYDERGQLVAYGGRIIGNGIPKYINSGDTPLFSKSHLLYGLNLAKEKMAKTGQGVLVEGYMDVIACHRAGVTNAVASLGTSLTEDQVKILKRWCQDVVILYDRDEAGQKAAEKATEMLMRSGVKARIALPPPGDDPDSLLEKEGPHAVERIIETAVDPIDHRLTLIRERFQPEDEEYWKQAVKAFALATSEMEIERRLQEFAREYPGTTDPASTRLTLYRLIKLEKRKSGYIDEQAIKSLSFQKEKPSLQRLIFSSILHEDNRSIAWPVLTLIKAYGSVAGRVCSKALLETFEDGIPEGAIGSWIHKIEDTRVIDYLSDIFENVEPPSQEDVLVACSRIKEKVEEYERVKFVPVAVRSDDDLMTIYERIKAVKGDREPKTKPPKEQLDDPFA